MLTLTGNGRLTRDVQLRTTNSGKTVATISVVPSQRIMPSWQAPTLRRPGGPAKQGRTSPGMQ